MRAIRLAAAALVLAALSTFTASAAQAEVTSAKFVAKSAGWQW